MSRNILNLNSIVKLLYIYTVICCISCQILFAAIKQNRIAKFSRFNNDKNFANYTPSSVFNNYYEL